MTTIAKRDACVDGTEHLWRLRRARGHDEVHCARCQCFSRTSHNTEERSVVDDLSKIAIVECACYGCEIARQRAGIPAPDRSSLLCDPPEACGTHGRCWTHSTWAVDVVSLEST